MKKIVVALGGNAIQAEDNSAAAQQEAVRKTMKTVASMIESGNQVAITHGNGPQVGNLLLQQHKGASENNPAMPLDTISAMTQGSIGYWMQKALDDQFKFDNYPSQAVALVTQTIVESNDPAFEHPTKPIGPFYTFNEMQNGIPELECYERFAKRCDLMPYIKLGALLAQNLKKGTKGLWLQLEMEAHQSMNDRKNQIKKLGEEAGTKLLLPMLIMLIVVLLIVIVPAFLSIQI